MTRPASRQLAATGVAICLAGTLAATPPVAYAWEPATQAGIAEEAALEIDLHGQLIAQGWAEGLYTPLTMADTSQPGLIAMIRRISPALGVYLDAKGTGSAIDWLIAGAIIADIGGAQHHFLNALAGRGLPQGWSLGAVAAKRSGLPRHGVAADEWVARKDNPLGVPAFYDQYEASLAAATPAQRQQHLAAALVAAGAVVHVLADMGSPSHVRDDEASHAGRLTIAGDLGNRLERVAALAFGRLGVPAPVAAVTFPTLRDFFVHPTEGLAVITAKAWYSESTLPRSGDDASAMPALPARLSLMAASQEQGTTLRNAAGVCLARYRLEVGRVSFWLDDACRLEQVGAILPTVTQYASGMLQYLFRGTLKLSAIGSTVVVTNAGVALGEGTLTLYGQARDGSRQRLQAVSVKELTATAELSVELAGQGSDPTLPYIAVFRGQDGVNQEIVAAGVLIAP